MRGTRIPLPTLPTRAEPPSEEDLLRGRARFGASAVVSGGRFLGTVLGEQGADPDGDGGTVLDLRAEPSWGALPEGAKLTASARRDQDALVRALRSPADAEERLYTFGAADRRALAAAARRAGALLGDDAPEAEDLATVAAAPRSPAPAAAVPEDLELPAPLAPRESASVPSEVETLQHAGPAAGAPRGVFAQDLFADPAGDARADGEDDPLRATEIYVDEGLTLVVLAATEHLGLADAVAYADARVLVMEPRPVAPELWPALDALLARDANPAAVAKRLVEPVVRGRPGVSAEEVVQTVRAKAEGHRAVVTHGLATAVRRVASAALESLSRDPSGFDAARSVVDLGGTVGQGSLETAFLVVLDQMARSGALWVPRKDLERELRNGVPPAPEELVRARVAVPQPAPPAPRRSASSRSVPPSARAPPAPVPARVAGHRARSSPPGGAAPPPAGGRARAPPAAAKPADPPARGVRLPPVKLKAPRVALPPAGLAEDARHAVYVLASGVRRALGAANAEASDAARALLGLSEELERTVGDPDPRVLPFAMSLAASLPAAAKAVRDFREAYHVPDPERIRIDRETAAQARRALWREREAEELAGHEGEEVADLPPPDTEWE